VVGRHFHVGDACIRLAGPDRIQHPGGCSDDDQLDAGVFALDEGDQIVTGIDGQPASGEGTQGWPPIAEAADDGRRLE
jgi:hypothetical protein